MKVRCTGYLNTTLVSLRPDLSTRRAGAPVVEADGYMVPQGGGVLEGHLLGVLVPVVARGLRDGLELVCLRGPVLRAEKTVRHFCSKLREPVNPGLRAGDLEPCPGLPVGQVLVLGDGQRVLQVDHDGSRVLPEELKCELPVHTPTLADVGGSLAQDSPLHLTLLSARYEIVELTHHLEAVGLSQISIETRLNLILALLNLNSLSAADEGSQGVVGAARVDAEQPRYS